MHNTDSLDWQPASRRWASSNIVSSLLIAAIPIAIGIFLVVRFSPWWWLLAGSLILMLAVTVLFSHRQVRYMAHAETADAILVREGRLWRTITLVPYGRLQHVEISEDYIEQRYGLAQLKIQTAGGPTTISGLEAGAARELRDRLVEHSRNRDEGL